MMTLTITRHATRPRAYSLREELWLPRGIDEVFAFFADAHQLEAITPPFLQFHVLNERPVPMSAGLLINYRLKLHGIPMTWQSRISLWEPPYRFVDEQVVGPYRFWHHLHTFEEQNGGTLVRDEVNYAVPGGALVHWLAVKRDLRTIFAYRTQRLTEFLGSASHESASSFPATSAKT